MFYPASILLMVGAVWCNRTDKKMLALCFTACAGFFSPLPENDWLMFYLCAIGTELCVGVIAWRINCAASQPIMVLSLLMVACHISGIFLDGYPPTSPYRILIPSFELGQFSILILMSSNLSRILHNHEPPPI